MALDLARFDHLNDQHPVPAPRPVHSPSLTAPVSPPPASRLASLLDPSAMPAAAQDLPLTPQPQHSPTFPHQEDEFSVQQEPANLVPDVDAQILEALKGKDRIYVLKLAEMFESLIRERRTRVELVPATSYQRLLVHRCSAYYRLTPGNDHLSKGISVLYTSESKIPERRISELVPAETTAHPAFQIMQRSTKERRSTPQSLTPVSGDDVDLSDVEASESGSQGSRNNTISSGSKKHKTIEEREAAYNEARSRIFMDFEDKSKDKDISANSSTLSLSGSASTSAGGRSNICDTDDPTTSPTTESEWSLSSVSRDRKDSRRSGPTNGSVTSTTRPLRPGASFNSSGGSSRNSRAPSPSFSYASLHDVSPAGQIYDPAQNPNPPMGYYPPYYPYSAPVQGANPPYVTPYNAPHYYNPYQPYSGLPPPHAPNDPSSPSGPEAYPPLMNMNNYPPPQHYGWSPQHPPPPPMQSPPNGMHMPQQPQNPPPHPMGPPPQPMPYPYIPHSSTPFPYQTQTYYQQLPPPVGQQAPPPPSLPHSISAHVHMHQQQVPPQLPHQHQQPQPHLHNQSQQHPPHQPNFGNHISNPPNGQHQHNVTNGNSINHSSNYNNQGNSSSGNSTHNGHMHGHRNNNLGLGNGVISPNSNGRTLSRNVSGGGGGGNGFSPNGGKHRGSMSPSGRSNNVWGYMGGGGGGGPAGMGYSSPLTTGGVESVGPRLHHHSNRRPSGNTSSGGNSRASSTYDEVSSTSSSTTSSSSRRTYTSTTSSQQHPLPARPDWAVGLKAQPTLAATGISGRLHDHSLSNSRTMPPISPPRSNGHSSPRPSHLNNLADNPFLSSPSPRPQPLSQSQLQHQQHPHQPQPQSPLLSLQAMDFPPLTPGSSLPDKKTPMASGAWSVSRPILSPANANGTTNTGIPPVPNSASAQNSPVVKHQQQQDENSASISSSAKPSELIAPKIAKRPTSGIVVNGQQRPSPLVVSPAPSPASVDKVKEKEPLPAATPAPEGSSKVDQVARSTSPAVLVEQVSAMSLVGDIHENGGGTLESLTACSRSC